MPHILAENEITRDSLAEQLENAGWVVELNEDHIGLRSDGGLYFTLHFDGERRFLRLYCYLPFRHDFDDQLELVSTLNSDVFLASFSLTEDRSLLRILYQMMLPPGPDPAPVHASGAPVRRDHRLRQIQVRRQPTDLRPRGGRSGR